MAYRRRKNNMAQYGVSLLMAVILVAIYFYGRANSTSEEKVAVEADTSATTDVIANASNSQPVIKPTSAATKPPTVTAKPLIRAAQTEPLVAAPAIKPKPIIQQVSVESARRLPPTPELKIDGQTVTSVFEPKILRVKDGDSLEVMGLDQQTFEIRLASVDAPEWDQPYGRVSRLHLQNLVAGKQVMAYQTDTDRYQRKVVFLFARDAISGEPYWEVNARMVADGYAWHAIKYSDNPKLTALQSAARTSRIGLWEQSRPIEPWVYRDSQ